MCCAAVVKPIFFFWHHQYHTWCKVPWGAMNDHKHKWDLRADFHWKLFQSVPHILYDFRWFGIQCMSLMDYLDDPFQGLTI